MLRGNLHHRSTGRARGVRALGVVATLVATAAMLVAAPAGASSQDVTYTLTPIFFGDVVLGTSTTGTSIVTNTSAQPIYFISASPSVNDFSAEYHASQGTCTGALAPSTSCDLSVVFAPNAKGLRASTLIVRFGEHNASGGVTIAATVDTALRGRGTPPTFTLTGGDAGDVAVHQYGSVSASITNTSAVPLTVNGYRLSNDGDKDFAISSDTCPIPVLPNGSCQLVATFEPHRLGSASATLSVSMLVAGSKASTVTEQATLRGTGVTVSGSTPPFELSTLDFGQVTVGTSAPGSVVLTNSSLVNETLTATAVGDDASGAYTITGNNCPTPIVPGGTCDIAVTYAPEAAVTHNATLVAHVSYANAHGVQVTTGEQTSITGEGVSPTFTLTPSSFPTTPIGATSDGTVTVTNTSLVALNYSATGFQGSDPASWSQEGSACTGPIEPETSCILDIGFTPHQQGTLSITIEVTLDLTVRSHTEDISLRAALVGRASLPTFSIAAPSLPSSTKGVAVSAPATITNTSQVSFSYDGFEIFGADPNAFTVTSTTCSSLLAPGGTCQATVQFTPTRTGPGTEHAKLKVIMAIAGFTPPLTTSADVHLTGTIS